jgi:O-glycosyl hydrolase
MRVLLAVTAFAAAMPSVVGQWQIWDMWQTTWNRKQLFTYQKISPPITFNTPSGTGDADIKVDDQQSFQSVWGFGGSLTDSSALLLNNLKSQDSASYQKLLKYLFDPTDGANSAGFSYLRVPLGASDFSASAYSFADSKGDGSLSNFNINAAPSYLFSVMKDIRAINDRLRIHIVPWSPPGWMKSTGTMRGGTFSSQYVSTYAKYLLKCLQGYKSKGITVYAISIQNEPEVLALAARC